MDRIFRQEFFPEPTIKREGKAGNTGLVNKRRDGFPVNGQSVSGFQERFVFSCIAGNMNLMACFDKASISFSTRMSGGNSRSRTINIFSIVSLIMFLRLVGWHSLPIQRYRICYCPARKSVNTLFYEITVTTYKQVIIVPISSVHSVSSRKVIQYLLKKIGFFLHAAAIGNHQAAML